MDALRTSTPISFTEADRSYIAATFVTLEELCRDRPESETDILSLIEEGALPKPAYVVDGEGFFPADYFAIYDAAGTRDLKSFFVERARAALREMEADYLEALWRGYLSGIYSVCVRDVSPETIVRKNALVDEICGLLSLSKVDDETWRRTLRDAVEALDEIERDFSPDHDRAGRFGRLTTRDLLIDRARAEHPAAFE